MARSKAPSSAATGFFQEPLQLLNQFQEDRSLQRAMKFFLPSCVASDISDELNGFGYSVISQPVLRWLADAERHPPSLEPLDTWGKRRNELITSEGWRQLQAMGLREGIVAIPHERRQGPHSRLYQFLKYHLWTGSCAMVTCPSAMQDGAAVLLQNALKTSPLGAETRQAFTSAYARLISRDPEIAWTSGQWMTERAGGSDVKGTETRASLVPDTPRTTPQVASDGSPLGRWRIDGYKWFSSATDADMTILLAKTGDSDDISSFMAPTRVCGDAQGSKSNIGYNGIQIQRLKSKLGTRALPTAELVLCGLRAHLIGEVGQGIKAISTVLNLTRVHNAVTAVGYWGRGLAISRAFSRVRKVGPSLLINNDAHTKGLAEQHVEYRAYVLFTFFVVSLFGAIEHANTSLGSENVIPHTAPYACMIRPGFQPSLVLRLLTPVVKASTALASIRGLRFCMESLGGVGYLENQDPELNIARLFRDVNVLSIWEGTTDVMASDTIRVLKDSNGPLTLKAFSEWAIFAATRWINLAEWLNIASNAVRDTVFRLENVIRLQSVDELLYHGREVMSLVEFTVTTVLLVEDSMHDGDVIASEVARRWIKMNGKGPVQWGLSTWKDAAAWDRKIAFDPDNFIEDEGSKPKL